MQNLARQTQATKLRFWGKIHGTEKDYYIAEGQADAPPANPDVEPSEPPANMEARGTGVNENSYWACNSPDENKWTLLPDLQPSDIEIARQIKFSFSGDLDRRIITNPFFHKRENVLLRAQIARISMGTTIVPKGIFKTEEEDPTSIAVVEPEDDKPLVAPTVPQMAEPKMWCHLLKSILNCNRTTLPEAEVPDGIEDTEGWQKARQAQDPSEPRLKFITEDASVKGKAPAWSIRSYGDMSTYLAANPNSTKLNFGVVVVRSNTWPGSYTFYTQQRQHMMVYVGDGLKFEALTYYPVHCPRMQADPVET